MMADEVFLSDNMLADLVFQVRWHFNYRGAAIKEVSPIVSGLYEIGNMDSTTIPDFLGDFGQTELIEVDLLSAKLTTGEVVELINYFSKGRDQFLGRAFLVAGDVVMQASDGRAWHY